jgi:hypothetical protein
VITDDDGRALLIRRRDTLHWEPPGGVLELDESIEAGLRREVRERTIGCSIPSNSHTGVLTAIVPSGIFAGHQMGRLAYLAAA